MSLRQIVVAVIRRVRAAPGFFAAFITALVLRLLRLRLLKVTHVDRIGHLVGEVDCALKEEALGRYPRRQGLLLAPRNEVANHHLVSYWRDRLAIAESPLLCRLLAPADRFAFARYRDGVAQYLSAIDETATFNAINSDWSDRPPLLQLREEDRVRGADALRALGVPAGARFVCLHARDGGYSPADEHYHSFRNAPIDTYLEAVAALHARGLYCVRMGDPTMPRMPPTLGGVDYAHSPLRAEWLDVFLCAQCHFFLGNTSGLYLISTAFGRASALTNLVPMSMAFSGGPRQLGIPKLLWHEAEQRMLSIPEVFASPVANYRFAELYEKARIRPVDNRPHEVRAFALEMLDRVDGVARYDAEDDALQARFRALLRPGHYGFGSTSRVGREFLREHAALLERRC